MEKKAIGAIVSISLLLVVTIVAVISYQSWYGSYSSNIFSSVEKSSIERNEVGIETLIGDQLYLKNLGNENISINQIIIGDKNCNISKNISYGVSNVDLSDCLSSLILDNSIDEITVVTDKDVITKKHLFKNINISSSSPSQSLEETSINWFGDESNGDILVNSTGVFQSFDDGVSYSIVPESTGTMWNSVEDGDMVVINAKDFIVESGVTFTTTNRCRGLMIYVSGDMIIDGIINMTARGAAVNPSLGGLSTDGNEVPSEGLVIRRAKSDWGDVDSTIISNAHASSLQDFNGTHNSSDLFYGAGNVAVLSEANQVNVSNGLVIKIPRVGGEGGNYANPGGYNTYAPTPSPKMFAFGGGGGGGSNGVHTQYPQNGGNATCFSGGAGAGGISDGAGAAPYPPDYGDADDFGGPGNPGAGVQSCGATGGAGNPGGAGFDGGTSGESGTGGLLLIFVKNDLNLNSGSIIVSEGMDSGTYSGYCASSGGGSGGGVIGLFYGNSLTDNSTKSVAGGLAGTVSASYPSYGAPGGEGSIIGPIKID